MDLVTLPNNDLANFILKNKDMVDKLSIEELTQLTQKLNPYSQVPVEKTEKSVLVSFTNFKADYYRLLKAISLQLFMRQMEKEHQEWVDSLDFADGEKELFLKHMKLFSDRFLKYDELRDIQNSEHKTGTSDFVSPSQDFLIRWQRYEDQNLKEIKTIMHDKYNYVTKFQCALQVYDVFESDDQVQKFVDQNSLSLGVDIMKIPTNKWVIMEETEETLEHTKFVGDDNQLLDQLIMNMKRDAQLGEKMLKQRVETKKKENQMSAGHIPPDVEGILETKSHGQQRLALATSDDLNDQTVVTTECPLIINQGGQSISNLKI